MTPLATAACAAVALGSGALNAVAGGGSFLLFPAMLAAGVAPVDANVATTLALWPASVSSTLAYRRELRTDPSLGVRLGLVSVAGGLAGARLLLATPEAYFVRLVPFMLLGATVLFTAGPALTRRLGTSSRSAPRLAGALVFQAFVAAYGGYFGGGMGILMLASFALVGIESIHAANALKSLLGVLINGAASVAFLQSGRGELQTTLPVVVAAVMGGYAAAARARRVDAGRVRRGVTFLAWCTTLGVCGRAWL